MRTPASIFKHPIHPMLIVFPIGLWIFSLACDLIRLAGASGGRLVDRRFFQHDRWSYRRPLRGGTGTYRFALLQGRRSAGEENRSDPHGDQSHRRRAVCDKYLAARQRPHEFGPKPERSRRAFDHRRRTPLVSGWLGGQMVHVYGVGVEGRE